MPKKLSKTTLALVFFIFTLILSIVGIFVMMSIFHPTYYIDAIKLDQKPDQYILLENPDCYTLQAINNPDHSVEVRAFEDTQIYGLLTTQKIYYVEYNSSYYSIGFCVGDKFPPAGLPQFLLAGIGISVSVVVVLSIKIINQIKNRHKEAG